MARITVNTTGTQPTLLISRDLINVTANVGNIANTLSVTCLQDVTITNSTGVYTYTDFCTTDVRKLTTPADNEISTNVVVDDIVWFGNTSSANTTASFSGLAGLSGNKIPIQFKLIMNGGNSTANAYWYAGQGFISSLAPTVSPDAPVWLSPVTIAVDGPLIAGKNP